MLSNYNNNKHSLLDRSTGAYPNVKREWKLLQFFSSSNCVRCQFQCFTATISVFWQQQRRRDATRHDDKGPATWICFSPWKYLLLFRSTFSFLLTKSLSAVFRDNSSELLLLPPLPLPLTVAALAVVAAVSGPMVWCTFKNFLSVTFMPNLAIYSRDCNTDKNLCFFFLWFSVCITLCTEYFPIHFSRWYQSADEALTTITRDVFHRRKISVQFSFFFLVCSFQNWIWVERKEKWFLQSLYTRWLESRRGVVAVSVADSIDMAIYPFYSLSCVSCSELLWHQSWRWKSKTQKSSLAENESVTFFPLLHLTKEGFHQLTKRACSNFQQADRQSWSKVPYQRWFL